MRMQYEAAANTPGQEGGRGGQPNTYDFKTGVEDAGHIGLRVTLVRNRESTASSSEARCMSERSVRIPSFLAAGSMVLGRDR